MCLQCGLIKLNFYHNFNKNIQPNLINTQNTKPLPERVHYYTKGYFMKKTPNGLYNVKQKTLTLCLYCPGHRDHTLRSNRLNRCTGCRTRVFRNSAAFI